MCRSTKNFQQLMYRRLTQSFDADIIIVGAGLSGMSAAYYILERVPSLTVVILEASFRIGGRTVSYPLKIAKPNNMHAFDLGGQFVLPNQIHLLDLLKRLNLSLIQAINNDGRVIWDLSEEEMHVTQSLHDFKIENYEIVLFLKMIKLMSKHVSYTNPHRLPDSQNLDLTTMEYFLYENLTKTETRNLMRHIIRNSCGVEASEISVLFYLAFCNATDNGINNFFKCQESGKFSSIKGGADQIVEKLASTIGKEFIKTNDPVIEIIRDDFQVIVETEKKTYQCKYAIVAIPPKQILEIRFNPPLNEERWNFLKSLQVGCLTKFVITYETAFWKERGVSGTIISSGFNTKGPIYWCYDITYNNWPALTGYVAPYKFSNNQNDSHKMEVIEQLTRYLGIEAMSPIDYFEQNWSKEPFIHGCFMHSPSMGTMDKYFHIKLPLGRLFWAGTETATNWNGLMAGAVQAGYRAAMEVLYYYRPQVLTTEDIEFIYPISQPEASTILDSIITYGTDWKTILWLAGIATIVYLFKKS